MLSAGAGGRSSGRAPRRRSIGRWLAALAAGALLAGCGEAPGGAAPVGDWRPSHSWYSVGDAPPVRVLRFPDGEQWMFVGAWQQPEGYRVFRRTSEHEAWQAAPVAGGGR